MLAMKKKNAHGICDYRELSLLSVKLIETDPPFGCFLNIYIVCIYFIDANILKVHETKQRLFQKYFLLFQMNHRHRMFLCTFTMKL